MALLEQTRVNWEKWCAQTPFTTGDQRTSDLLDSLLCLVRSHVGAQAIHTGSLRYPHNRAWVRDSYWVQRTLLELGRVPEAKVGLDFFHRAWQQHGLASSYYTTNGRPVAYGYSRVELPHYLVLMVRDADWYGRVPAKPYWDMVRGCLDRAAVTGSGLQPMNGDETWILAAPVRELDSMLDNSWLLIASAEYGSKLAQRMGDRSARRAMARWLTRPGSPCANSCRRPGATIGWRWGEARTGRWTPPYVRKSPRAASSSISCRPPIPISLRN